jgi:hypothetical protein
MHREASAEPSQTPHTTHTDSTILLCLGCEDVHRRASNGLCWPSSAVATSQERQARSIAHSLRFHQFIRGLHSDSTRCCRVSRWLRSEYMRGPPSHGIASSARGDAPALGARGSLKLHMACGERDLSGTVHAVVRWRVREASSIARVRTHAGMRRPLGSVCTRAVVT